MSSDCDFLLENTDVVRRLLYLHPPFSFLKLKNEILVSKYVCVQVDFLARVAAYPKPDDKIRSTSFKVADDTQGRDLLHELEVDGVDTSFMACLLLSAGFPPMKPVELSESSLLSALNGARIVYFDGILLETALVVAHEAVKKNIPILMDAERLKEGLDDLMKLADYVVCAAPFPQAWTEASTIPKALVCMLLRLPTSKFVIVTLGKDGCIMLERCVDEDPSVEEVDVDKLLESLEMRKNGSTHIPTCISSSVAKLHSKGIGTVCGRLYIGTAENIPASELIDTTGAGDAFIGAVLYAICSNFAPEKMVCFAATVAASKCRALGARSGLPYSTDPCLASFME
ncbi:hypothetical protein VNO78_17516 [Psophocarpus tetragonolobus]|uniref:Carbohydrate kinase PfkB domain-containing protein n=1 Tax=Psophocarpus tetragonolobus TaxID=3891 RepID=A0AAN9XLC4_PSOTE